MSALGDLFDAEAEVARLRQALRDVHRVFTPTGDPDVDADFDEREAILRAKKIIRAALKVK